MTLSFNANLQRRFGGIARLYGEAGLSLFAQSHVCVVGLGGVGSWAAEALARTGIGSLTLIDPDNVSESNVNRQLVALDPYFGCAKVDVLADRIHAINPTCHVNTVEEWLDDKNVNELLQNKRFDYLIDAIDDNRSKAALVAWCVNHQLPIVVCGGAGGRIDPQQINKGDLATLTGDPLLANLRYNLRRYYGFEKQTHKKWGVLCVYSAEPLKNPPCADKSSLQGLSCAGYGASMMVTATFGLLASAMVTSALAAPLNNGIRSGQS